MTRPNLRDERSPVRGRFRPALALTAASTVLAMVAYAGPLGNAPTLATALSASPFAMTWMLSSMSVGLAVSLLSLGALADDRGSRRVFSGGALVFTVGSLVCGLARVPAWYVLGRLIQGVGAAGLVATGLALVAAVTTTSAQRSVTASWWGVSMGAGIAIGPLATGLLDWVDWWRGFYWLLAAAGIVIAVTASRWFVETAPEFGGRLDLPGLVTMTGGLGLLLAALIEVRAGRESIAAVAGVAAAALMMTFVATQLRGRRPMLDPALLRRPDFAAATLAAFATGSGVVALMSFVCTFLVLGIGLTTFAAAAVLAVWSATSALAAVWARRLPPHLVGNPQLVIGLVGVGVGMLFLAGLSVDFGPWRMVPGLLLAGLASGILNTGLGRQAVASAPTQRAALGTGTNNTARYVGAAIGITIVSLVTATTGSGRSGWVTGWNVAALITAGISLVSALGVLGLARRPASHRS